VAKRRLAEWRLQNGVWQNGVWQNGIDLQGVQVNGVQVSGVLGGTAKNELVGTSADGRAMSGEAFLGATVEAVLSDGSRKQLVIADFSRSTDGKIANYKLTLDGQNICGDADGMFVPGIWDQKGARTDRTIVDGRELSVSYSCATGAIAKCVTWGYAPWVVGADVHQTCTRMVRADYCGSGASFTKNGTVIDVFDDKEFRRPQTKPASSSRPGGARMARLARRERVTTPAIRAAKP
jgi:hypothetical protein